MLFKNDLDRLTCGVPGCAHANDDIVYVHSNCHRKAPHQVVKTGGIITAGCPTCRKIAIACVFKDEKLVNAHWKHGLFLCQRCHPDQRVWLTYAAGSGVAIAACSRCDGHVAEFTVPDRTTDLVTVRLALAGPGKPETKLLEAVRVSPTTVRVKTIPLLSQACTCGDLVEINQTGDVIRVLEHRGRHRFAEYRTKNTSAHLETCGRLGMYFLENSVLLDARVDTPGLIALHIPPAIADARIQEICANAPVPLILLPSGVNPRISVHKGNGDGGAVKEPA
jgi:hypothetical protein